MDSPTRTPRAPRKRRRRRAIAARPILATLAQLAIAGELYATGKRLTVNPIVVAIAEAIGDDCQPMVAAIAVYCRSVDRCHCWPPDDKRQLPCLSIDHPALRRSA
jgi:hypothetical protein